MSERIQELHRRIEEARKRIAKRETAIKQRAEANELARAANQEDREKIERWRQRIEELQGSELPSKPGIDISEHQPNVDWSKVKGDAGFAFVKATEGRTYVDKAFSVERVRKMAEAFPGAHGFYHFARPDNNTPSAEAEHFVKTVRERNGVLAAKGICGHYPNGVLDYEVARGGSDDNWIAEWVATYQKLTGHRPLIYGGSVLRENTTKTFGCELWLAAYVSDPDPYVPAAWKLRGWKLWQFTSSGRCAGIPGDVDRNKIR